MKPLLLCGLSLGISIVLALVVYGVRLARAYVTIYDSGCDSLNLQIEKHEHNDITYSDGHRDQIDTVGYGGCSSQGYQCYPEFKTPKSWDGHWEQDIVDKRVYGGSVCTYISNDARHYESNYTCQTAGGCTTAGWDGSCPPDTYPNGGMCCADGRCDGFTSLPADHTASIIPGSGSEQGFLLTAGDKRHNRVSYLVSYFS
ncbi:MAG: hypothetical protein QOG00_3954 [Pyrinomonadaceae bacterium]|nr:hypothetical protein [Pyrinomonadaceae bacterium]